MTSARVFEKFKKRDPRISLIILKCRNLGNSVSQIEGHKSYEEKWEAEIQPAIFQCVRDFRTAGRFRAAVILLSVGCVIGRTSRIYLASASQKLSA